MIREPMGQWFVWTKSGHMPRHAHPDYDAAIAEAQRLAREHPGKKFIVLQMLAKFHEPIPLTEPVQGDPLKEAQDAQV